MITSAYGMFNMDFFAVPADCNLSDGATPSPYMPLSNSGSISLATLILEIMLTEYLNCLWGWTNLETAYDILLDEAVGQLSASYFGQAFSRCPLQVERGAYHPRLAVQFSREHRIYNWGRHAH